MLSRARPSWRVAETTPSVLIFAINDPLSLPYYHFTRLPLTLPVTALLSRSSRRSRSMHTPRTRHLSITYSACVSTLCSTCYGSDPFARITREASVLCVPPTPPHRSGVMHRLGAARVLAHSLALPLPLSRLGPRPTPPCGVAHVTTCWADRHRHRCPQPCQPSPRHLSLASTSTPVPPPP